MDPIVWQVSEFNYQEKGLGWYLGVIALVVILTTVALWQKNLLFAAFSIIAGALIINQARKKPRVINCQLAPPELIIDKKLYSLKDFSEFQMNEEFLVLLKANRFSSPLKVPIKKELENTIRNILQPIMPEVEYRQSLNEALARYLKF
jgi:hypothetical protein